MALAQQYSSSQGGSDTAARRGRNTRLDTTQKPDIEIELTEIAPTIQQRQAYEQFWKLFLDRIVTKPHDKNP